MTIDTSLQAQWTKKLAESVLIEYPTTLRELFDDSTLFHVYTEYKGLRYYVASETTFARANGRANEYRIAYPKAMTFIRDRADSTQIDGAWQELRTAYHGA